jgi:hypothetical protein
MIGGPDVLSAGSAPVQPPVRFRVGLTIGGVVQAASLADAQSMLAAIVEAVSAHPDMTAVEVQTTTQQIPS